MKHAPGEILRHVRYLTWASKAVAAANRDWRARGGFGDVLLTRGGLHRALFSWAVEEGLLKPSRQLPTSPPSFHVARVFDTHRAQTIDAARAYWRRVLTEQTELVQ